MQTVRVLHEELARAQQPGARDEPRRKFGLNLIDHRIELPVRLELGRRQLLPPYLFVRHPEHEVAPVSIGEANECGVDRVVAPGLSARRQRRGPSTSGSPARRCDPSRRGRSVRCGASCGGPGEGRCRSRRRAGECSQRARGDRGLPRPRGRWSRAWSDRIASNNASECSVRVCAFGESFGLACGRREDVESGPQTNAAPTDVGECRTVRQSSADEFVSVEGVLSRNRARDRCPPRGLPDVGRGSGRVDRMVFRLMHEY